MYCTPVSTVKVYDTLPPVCLSGNSHIFIIITMMIFIIFIFALSQCTYLVIGSRQLAIGVWYSRWMCVIHSGSEWMIRSEETPSRLRSIPSFHGFVYRRVRSVCNKLDHFFVAVGNHLQSSLWPQTKWNRWNRWNRLDVKARAKAKAKAMPTRDPEPPFIYDVNNTANTLMWYWIRLVRAPRPKNHSSTVSTHV